MVVAAAAATLLVSSIAQLVQGEPASQ